MWSNYHSHSKYCDGKGELSEYLLVARSHKIVSMGFSSHAPLPFPCAWCMKAEDLGAYFEDVEHLRFQNHDLEIYKSLEIDFVPGVSSPFMYRDLLDYTIGSIHFVDQFADGRRWEIDNTLAVFREGLENIFKGSIRDAVVRYLELTREMIFASAPDIVGHLDKIKMHNLEGKFFDETETWYRHEIEKTLKLIRTGNLIVEVNTRGLYKKKADSTYPSPWILEKIKDLGIPITLSSDAHHTSEIMGVFHETAGALFRQGFRTLSVMTEGKWQQLPFNEHGIIR
jgi:histidinol-phosphatase (PHP family)